MLLSSFLNRLAEQARARPRRSAGRPAQRAARRALCKELFRRPPSAPARPVAACRPAACRSRASPLLRGRNAGTCAPLRARAAARLGGAHLGLAAAEVLTAGSSVISFATGDPRMGGQLTHGAPPQRPVAPRRSADGRRARGRAAQRAWRPLAATARGRCRWARPCWACASWAWPAGSPPSAWRWRMSWAPGRPRAAWSSASPRCGARPLMVGFRIRVSTGCLAAACESGLGLGNFPWRGRPPGRRRGPARCPGRGAQA